mgnify:CR=1 FL=1
MFSDFFFDCGNDFRGKCWCVVGVVDVAPCGVGKSVACEFSWRGVPWYDMDVELISRVLKVSVVEAVRFECSHECFLKRTSECKKFFLFLRSKGQDIVFVFAFQNKVAASEISLAFVEVEYPVGSFVDFEVLLVHGREEKK